jgi:ParB family transcriptional regulator, chromosome partitioning protein
MATAIRVEMWKTRDLRTPSRGSRLHLTAAQQKDLLTSLKRFGLLQPIVVKPDGEVVIGQRRAEAAKVTGLKEVPVIVRRDLMDEIEALQLRLSEEMSHNPMDRLTVAEHVATLYKHHKREYEQQHRKFTQEDLAERLGVSESTISHYEIVAKMPEPVKKEIREERISLSDAIQVGRATGEPSEQAKLAKKIAQGKIPGGRTLEEEVVPLIKRAPETVKEALIRNPRTTFADVQRHIKRQEEKGTKASKEVGRSIQGFAAGVIERVRYWRESLRGLEKANVLPLFSEYDWVRLERALRELMEQIEDSIKARNKQTLQEARELLETKPERAIDMVKTAEGKWEAS